MKLNALSDIATTFAGLVLSFSKANSIFNPALSNAVIVGKPVTNECKTSELDQNKCPSVFNSLIKCFCCPT